MESTFVNALPGFHAFSGSDYTASFMNKGKVKPLDLLQKQEAFCEAFAQLGEKDSVNEDVVLSLEAFVCTMYGKTKMKNVDEVRHAMFQQHYAPKNDKDPLQKIKGINPSSMPPCHQVLMNKIKRANYGRELQNRHHRHSAQTEMDGNSKMIISY